jgi:hypothetical protein
MHTAIPMAQSENAAAETYVRLVLALGQHDANFVDAYYGPPTLRQEAARDAWTLADINKRAAVLEVDLRRLPAITGEPAEVELHTQRRAYLARQLNALRAACRCCRASGSRSTRSRASYDAVAPQNTEASFRPPSTPSAAPRRHRRSARRYAALPAGVRDSARPPDAVFTAAIAECGAAPRTPSAARR